MDDVTLPIIMKMEEQMDSYAMLVNPLIKTVYDVINAMGEGEIHFEGMNKLLQYPEFSDVEQMRRMFDFFERKNDIFSLVEHADTENGVDIFMKKNGVSAPIPYADDCTDRDTTLRSIQEYLSPQYQLRWYMGSLGSDTLAFCIYPTSEWEQVEQEFGAEKVAFYFAPVQADSVMFEMDMNEVFALLEQRGEAQT